VSPLMYLMDTPGVLAPKVDDISTALALAAVGCVKDSDALIPITVLADYVLRSLAVGMTPRGATRALEALGLTATEFDALVAPDHAEDDPSGADAVSVGIQLALSSIAHRIGAKSPGGGVDLRPAALHVVQCFRSGKLGPVMLDGVTPVAQEGRL
jgi:hypothetical protein